MSIRPAVLPRQGQVLLHHHRPQGHGRRRHRGAPGVIREPHGYPEGLGQMGNRPQVHLLRRRRVGTGALEQHQLPAAAFAQRAHRLPDLLQGRHAGGQDHRLARGCHAPQEGEVHQLEGGDLVQGDVHRLQKRHRGGIEGAGEEDQPETFGDFLEARLPVPRGVSLLVQAVQGSPLPGRAFADAEPGLIRIQGQGVGGVGLELDGVRPGLPGRFDQAHRPVEVLPMVGRQLGDDKHRLTGSDAAISEGDRGEKRRRTIHGSSSPYSRLSLTWTRLPSWTKKAPG